MNIEHLQNKTAKNWLKTIFLASLLLIGISCSQDELVSPETDDMSLLNTAAKSDNSVQLTYSSGGLTASAEQSSNPIANIDDDSMTSRWSANGISSNVYIDFETEVTIDYLNLAFHRGDERKTSFSYWYSNDGSNWIWKGSKTSAGQTEDHQEFDLSNITARYFRLKFQGSTYNDGETTTTWNSVLDLEVFGTPGTDEPSTTCNATTPSGRSSNATSDSATLSWNAITNIDHYNVRYKATNSSNWLYQYSLDTNSATLTGLLSGTDYEWQVRAKCGDNSASEYADGNGTFTTEGDDSPPVSGGSPEAIVGDFWKITLPIDTSGNGSGLSVTTYNSRNNDAGESYDLSGVVNNSASEFNSNAGTNDYLYVDGDWLVFKAFCGGATTENSQYPRSELRGLDSSGDDSYFDMDDHQELEVIVKVLEVPTERPEVNMVQIHGPNDEPLRVEFNDGSTGSTQGLHLTVNESDDNHNNVISYSMGQELKVWVKVVDGHLWLELTNLSNGDTYQTNYNVEDETGYWKVGCYLQGSITYCDVKSSTSFCENGGESDDYYTTGSVAVKDLSLIRDGQTYK